MKIATAMVEPIPHEASRLSMKRTNDVRAGSRKLKGASVAPGSSSHDEAATIRLSDPDETDRRGLRRGDRVSR
jgi:hypothetical protein